MAAQRNISIQIPVLLLDKISNRASVHDRTRNAEFRYLLNYALEEIGDADITIKLPDEGWVKTIARIDYDTREILTQRAHMYQRHLGRELVRLVAYAVQRLMDRDLAIIGEMMQRQGLTGDVPPAIAPAAFRRAPQVVLPEVSE